MVTVVFSATGTTHGLLMCLPTISLDTTRVLFVMENSDCSRVNYKPLFSFTVIFTELGIFLPVLIFSLEMRYRGINHFPGDTRDAGRTVFRIQIFRAFGHSQREDPDLGACLPIYRIWKLLPLSSSIRHGQGRHRGTEKEIHNRESE